MMKRGARISAPPRFGSDHGRYIYAYCNIRTNQVVYSLTHTLNVRTQAHRPNHKPHSIL